MNGFPRQPAEDHRSLDSPGMDKQGKRGLRLPRLAVLLGLVCIGLAISACQENRDNLLADETATGLNQDIDQINQLVAEGDCLEALKLTERIRLEVEGLGDEADPVLRTVLLDGVTRLAVAVQRDCEPAAPGEAVEETDGTDSTEEPVTADPGSTEPEADNPVQPDPSGGDQGGSPDTGSGGVSPGGTQPEPAPPTPPQGGTGG